VTALVALLLAAGISGADGLAPGGPGLVAEGSTVFLVVLPLPGEAGKVKLLLSDAQTDAPLQAEIEVQRFGAAEKSARAQARSGDLAGHYFVELKAAPEDHAALVLKVTVSGRDPELLVVNGLATSALPLAPPTPLANASPATPARDLTVAAMLGMSLFFLLLRRTRRESANPLRPLMLVGLVFWAADARAHGPQGDRAPEPPGSLLYLAQEIQFALGVRTAPVELKRFAARESALAPRQYPAVPRNAVVERYGKKLVIVRLGPEQFVAREVTLGWAEGDWVAVERGVNPGERVVVSGGAFLRNGGAVAP